jgi:outer membrane protein OmpA-like peptidoglycan-associated protein
VVRPSGGAFPPRTALTPGIVRYLQRSAGNAATSAFLAQRAAGPTRYEPGEKAASVSSPGKVERRPDGILLYGFPVNKKFIKPEHQNALQQLVRDFGLAEPATMTPISITLGFTDDVRRSAGNAELRADRAAAVSFMLGVFGAADESLGRNTGAPLGQSVADNGSRAGRERNRAVLITLDASVPDLTEPKQPTTPGAPKNKKWSIRTAVQAATPKPGAGVQEVIFILHDKTLGKKKVMSYSGGGAGASIGLPVGFGISDADFETGPRVTFTDFNGGGGITGADIGPLAAVCRVFLPPTTIPMPVDASGFSLQLMLGLSVTRGVFVVEP